MHYLTSFFFGSFNNYVTLEGKGRGHARRDTL